jgi:hypothetical protein
MSKEIIEVDNSESLRQMVNFTLREAGYEVKDIENHSLK